MYEPKPISREAIPAALAKGERYRLLNQPAQAESICLDVLQVDPNNQEALVMLLLSLTEQFGEPGQRITLKEGQVLLPRLEGAYERHYYDGILSERWGRALLAGKVPAYVALDWIRGAMELFEKAEALRAPGNDDAILRWNACARLLQRLELHGPIAASADSEGDFGFDSPVA